MLVISVPKTLETTKTWFDMNQEMPETLLVFYCCCYCRPPLPCIHMKSLPLKATYELYVKSHKWQWTSFESDHNGATKRDQPMEQCSLIIRTWTLYEGSTKRSGEGKCGCVYDNVKVHHHCVVASWPYWRSVIIMLERKEGVGDLLTIQQVLSSESEEERKNKEGSSGSIYNNDKWTERDKEKEPWTILKASIRTKEYNPRLQAHTYTCTYTHTYSFSVWMIRFNYI